MDFFLIFFIIKIIIKEVVKRVNLFLLGNFNNQ